MSEEAPRAPVFYPTWFLRPTTPLECCRIVRDAGFDGVSFMAGMREDLRRLDLLSEPRAAGLRSFLAGMNLGRSLHVWTDSYLEVVPDAAAAGGLIKKHIQACAAALCGPDLPPLTVTLDPPVAWYHDRPLVLTALAEDLVRFLAGLRESHDVRPGLEHWPFEPIATPESLAPLLGAGQGRVGVLLDSGHANVALHHRWCRERDMAEFVKALPAPIVEVHLHDNRGGKDEHLMPGRGTADLQGLLQAVREAGFAGPITIESDLAAGGRPGLADGLRQIRANYGL
ncbi:MAG: sugar phosphate isomerase/epimerase family protein [Planctomycetota bacterium]|jgi:sugar phosphate isomerase/epimerase